MIRLSAVAITTLLLPTITFARAPDIAELDEYIAGAPESWDVPGLAVAIVKDDQVVLAKGYGVREHGKAEGVDADTLFAIASSTKAFTATTLAMLTEEGKLTWKDPVQEHLPYFRLYDPYVTREITVHGKAGKRAQGFSLTKSQLVNATTVLAPPSTTSLTKTMTART